LANFSEWIINGANVKLVKNNTNGLYMIEITTNTQFVFKLTLTDSEWDSYKSGNFFALTEISQKQSEVGVQFEPKNDIEL
jgi:uncharacterized protein YfdQ (DUF2303 family)